jgi:hypothetical protein
VGRYFCYVEPARPGPRWRGLSVAGADGLDVNIILGKKVPKIFEDLDPFKNLPINTKLLLQSQC